MREKTWRDDVLMFQIGMKREIHPLCAYRGRDGDKNRRVSAILRARRLREGRY